ncbi:hypothetical protein RQP46_000159 [Phenoliferia psychrophenolica]
MAPFASLPPEILTHIHTLSNEGESAQEEQRSRFEFGLIARAFYLATADATDFHVAGEKQAKTLLAKLEQEALEAACGSLARVSNIRRLSLVVDNEDNGNVFVELLRASSNLIALELDVVSISQSSDAVCATLVQLETALGELTSLRELSYRAYYIERNLVLRILIPLKELQVLDLDISCCPSDDNHQEWQLLLDRLSLLHFRKLRIGLFRVFDEMLLRRLATSTASGIQVLDLTRTEFNTMSLRATEYLIPDITTVIHLTWTPEELNAFPSIFPLRVPARDASLALIGAMKNLQHISISIGHLDNVAYYDFAPSDPNQPADRSVLGTLATLPSLHTVNLVVGAGSLDPSKVISFIGASVTLRLLSVKVGKKGWTLEEKERVESASEEAGVSFAYVGAVSEPDDWS